MDETYCPNCHRLLPEDSQYCVECGKIFAASDADLQDIRADQEVAASSGGRRRTRPLTEQDVRAGQEVSASNGSRRRTRPLTEQNVQRHAQSGRINSSLLDEDYEDDGLDSNIEEEIASVAEPRHETWQKVVEAPSRPPVVHPPRPQFPAPLARSILRNMPSGRSHISPALLFWCSVIVIFFFVGGGVFGIVGTLGRGHIASAAGAVLQVTPGDVAVGATVNLRGSGFSPRVQVGFTRDAAIPVVDTNGMTIITTDGDGSFTDTVIVGPDWVNGAHTINAEDAVTHKLTSSPIQVTGVGNLLRPAHLGVSITALDLGVGDQATNSVKEVVLTNLGGGQISWQAAATQPWLTISPKSGTFSSGMKAEVEIAANRANLQEGSFNDQVLFSSSAGDAVLLVNMGVTALQSQGEAVLQTAPATLSFTGTDGGLVPDDQAVTISNPGQLPLHWRAGANVPWLTISSQTGTIDAAGSVSARVHVDSRNLLPGTYNGNITFQGDGTTLHSPQSIAVSVTILPGCALTVAPNVLTFTAGYQHSMPDPKVINLGTNHCSSSITWHATSHASWLTVGQTSGPTPARPTIGINVTNLRPGTYTSSVTFSSDAGKQEVPVKFIMSRPAETALSVGVADSLNFFGMAGQQDIKTKDITLANTGDGTLLWHAKVTTGNGGGWLTVSSDTGKIAAHQSITLHVSAKTLADMLPDTYSGNISITGTDEQGHEVAGSPQNISVSEVVNANCVLAASPSTLTFAGAPGQSTPGNQSITLAVGQGCSNRLNWTAQVAGDNGGKWLSINSSAGSVSAHQSGTIGVGVSLAGLAAGNYSGTITITTIDSVTHATVGNAQIILVTLSVQSAAPTLTVSPTALTFTTMGGQASQAITISNSGGAAMNWQVSLQSGAPSFVSLSKAAGSNLAGGNSATVDVNVDTAAASGEKIYKTSIIVQGINPANGNAIGGRSLTIPVTVIVKSPTATPSPTVTPSPVATVALKVSTTALSFSARAGTNPGSQTITITNSGGGSLSWVASTPSQSWLLIDPRQGNEAAGASSTISISANVTGLAPGTHNATVVLTPSSGPPVTIRALLKISAPAPTPVVEPNPTPLPTRVVTPQPTPTMVVAPTPTPVVVPTPKVTVTPTQAVTATPVVTSAPTPDVPTPVPTHHPTYPHSPDPGATKTSLPKPNSSSSGVQTAGAPSPVVTIKPRPTVPPIFKKPTPKNIISVPPVVQQKPTPLHVKVIPSPTSPPKSVPTQEVVVKATPKPANEPSPTPTISVRPTPTPDDDQLRKHKKHEASS